MKEEEKRKNRQPLRLRKDRGFLTRVLPSTCMRNVLTQYGYKYSYRARDEEEIQTQRASVARKSRKRIPFAFRSNPKTSFSTEYPRD